MTGVGGGSTGKVLSGIAQSLKTYLGLFSALSGPGFVAGGLAFLASLYAMQPTPDYVVGGTVFLGVATVGWGVTYWWYFSLNEMLRRIKRIERQRKSGELTKEDSTTLKNGVIAEYFAARGIKISGETFEETIQKIAQRASKGYLEQVVREHKAVLNKIAAESAKGIVSEQLERQIKTSFDNYIPRLKKHIEAEVNKIVAEKAQSALTALKSQPAKDGDAVAHRDGQPALRANVTRPMTPPSPSKDNK